MSNTRSTRPLTVRVVPSARGTFFPPRGKRNRRGEGGRREPGRRTSGSSLAAMPPMRASARPPSSSWTSESWSSSRASCWLSPRSQRARSPRLGVLGLPAAPRRPSRKPSVVPSREACEQGPLLLRSSSSSCDTRIGCLAARGARERLDQGPGGADFADQPYRW